MPALWLRSIRERPHTAVLLCLLSALAVLVAVLGPLLVRAVQQSTLSSALADGGLAGTSLTVSADVDGGQSYEVARQPVLDAMTPLTTGEAARLWQQPVMVIRSTSIVIWKASTDATGIEAQVNAVESDCAGFVITEGECPTGKGLVMISSVDAERQHLTSRDRITFSLAKSAPVTLAVVGVYDAGASAEQAGLVRPGTTAGVLAGVKGDPLVMSPDQASALGLPMRVTARATLHPDLPLADVPTVESSIDATKAAVNAQDRLLALLSPVPDVLQRVATQARDAQILIMVTGMQALFVAIFALAIVLQRVGRARAAEWGVGRLRGVPRFRWLGSIYAEPLVALLLGLPLGFAAGVGVARLAVSWTLRPGTAVEPWHWSVVGYALVATVIAVGALVAVSLRSLRQPLADLVQQQAESRRLGVVGAVAHAAVFMIAAASVYQLVSGGMLNASGGQLGLLAPGLLALAVALLAVRGAVFVVRRITTRPPRGLTALVVGRHAARTPSSLNPAMIIAVGVALTVFATQMLALSVRNQGLRAAAETGAATVLTVSVPRGGDLLSAVRAADPDGRYAMAVQDTGVGDYSGPSRLIAVDSSRLAAVAAWSSEWAGVADVGASLRGTLTPAIQLRGRTITVDLAEVATAAKTLPDPTAPNAVDPAPPPRLVITVAAGGTWRSVDLGQLDRSKQPGDQRLTAELPCADGCRLVGIGLQARTNQPYEASFMITSVATDQQPAGDSHAWLRTDGRWREQSTNLTVPEVTANLTPSPGPAGLAVKAFDDKGSGLVSMSPTDTADPLPAVLGPGTSVEPVPGQEGVGYGTGLDGQQQKLQVLGQAAILPRSLRDGVLVDLGNAAGLVDPSTVQAIDQVWLAADAPASVEQSLTAHGLRVESRESLADHRTSLQSQATTRGAAVAVVIGAVVLVLTLLALIAARWADASSRGHDWRALREGGVGTRRLRRLVGVEIAVPAALAVLVGMLSGSVAAVIAAPRLPLVDLSTPGPPLDLGLQWWSIAAIGAGTLVALMIIAAVGAVVEIRSRRMR